MHDSIRVDQFHLNFAKNKIDTVESFTISSDVYKTLVIDSNIFTEDMRQDFETIYAKLVGFEVFPMSHSDSLLIADSIAAVEAIAAEAAAFGIS